eukprot:COSAG02_NODE_625_length_19372_cov_14.475355_1_plen_97_part_00
MIEQADGSVKMSNMTIICLMLHVCGPMREDMLTKRLLSVQVVCTAFAFIVRCVSSGIPPVALQLSTSSGVAKPTSLRFHLRACSYKFAAVLYENVE